MAARLPSIGFTDGAIAQSERGPLVFVDGAWRSPTFVTASLVGGANELRSARHSARGDRPPESLSEEISGFVFSGGSSRPTGGSAFGQSLFFFDFTVSPRDHVRQDPGRQRANTAEAA